MGAPISFSPTVDSRLSTHVRACVTLRILLNNEKIFNENPALKSNKISKIAFEHIHFISVQDIPLLLGGRLI